MDEEETTAENGFTTEPASAEGNRPTRRSLNEEYGGSVGIWQSLSLLLNAGLMVYAHVGLSAVIVSNQQRIQDSVSSQANTFTNETGPPSHTTSSDIFNQTGACTLGDYEVWESGGAVNKSSQSNFCARQYGTAPCLINSDCNAECFQESVGYSANCASCFGNIPLCSAQSGCAFICQEDNESDECITCTIPCNEEFYICSGLSPILLNESDSQPTLSPSLQQSFSDNDGISLGSDLGICDRQGEGVSVQDVEELFVVYDLMFFSAIKTAWTSDARLLAVIVFVFSGVWPYAKNFILLLAWYLPLATERRSSILVWLKRLGKYTLVDIFIVILIMIGVALEISVAGGVSIVIKGEPRAAILAFLVATIWEFFHIEWMVVRHEKMARSPAIPEETGKDILSALRFHTDKQSNESSLICMDPAVSRLCVWMLLFVAIFLFAAGSCMEVVRFTTTRGGETEGCVASFNFYTLGLTLVSDFFLHCNSATAGVWILFLAYALFVIIVPVVVHLLHITVLVFNWKQEYICKFCDSCWTFSSVEIMLLSIFTVQYKFSDLVGALAGNDGSQFFGIDSALGPGFWVLLVYSIFGGLIHYVFNNIATQYYNIEPYRKVDFFWTKIFGCLLGIDDQ